VPVPKDVQRAYGRREFTKSLGERDKTRAAEKALPLLISLKNQWRSLRSQTENSEAVHRPTPKLPPTEEELDFLIGKAYSDSCVASQVHRTKAFSADQDGYDSFIQNQEINLSVLIRAIEAQNFEMWVEPAQKILASRGYEVDRDQDWFKRFVGKVAEVTVAAIDVSNRRDRGDLSAQPRSEVVNRAHSMDPAKAGPKNDIRFSALVEDFMRQWMASQGGRKKTNTEQQKLATYQLFRGFWNNDPVRGVTRARAAEFRDTLKLFDPHWGRSPTAKELSWTDLVVTYGGRVCGLSDATMNRHMAALQDIWRWAQKRGHCDGVNPFDGFHTKLKPGINVRPYVAWETDELTRLFTPPPRRQDVLEVMIVGMLTGMRLDEIASLTWERIQTASDRDGPVTYFQIEDAKTPADNRQVPLHPALAWLKTRTRGAAHERVWPRFNLEGRSKKAGADAGREFSTFKIKRGFSSETKVFHSFRKNVTRMMERAGVPESQWVQIFGHERGFTYARYNPDGITLQQKSDIIGLIEYPELIIPYPETTDKSLDVHDAKQMARLSAEK
jgi:integrase